MIFNCAEASLSSLMISSRGFQHMKNSGIIQRLLSIIHKCIKSKSSALVHIKKRRGGNCRCRYNVFIPILQVFQRKLVELAEKEQKMMPESHKEALMPHSDNFSNACRRVSPMNCSNISGLMCLRPIRTAKCRCGLVDRPVLPLLPTTPPGFTQSPRFT